MGDSGLMIIRKSSSKRALEFLMETICGDIGVWGGRSSGDKDLWHLAWDLTETEYVYVPYVGGVGSKNADDISTWAMTGQVKFDEEGIPLVMHQIWTRWNIRPYDFVLKADLRQGLVQEPYKLKNY